MQPLVMQPVTITVSTLSRVRIAAAGVAKKIEGADFTSRTSGASAAMRGSSSASGPSGWNAVTAAIF